MIRLLAVDDEQGVCDFIKDFFSARGYRVLTATDPQAALSIVEKEHPRLVFLDVYLAGTSGLDILKTIKDTDPAVKVIMVTVANDLETRERSLAMGADAYITKPFSKRYLEEVVIEKIIELTRG